MTIISTNPTKVKKIKMLQKKFLVRITRRMLLPQCHIPTAPCPQHKAGGHPQGHTGAAGGLAEESGQVLVQLMYERF